MSDDTLDELEQKITDWRERASRAEWHNGARFRRGLRAHEALEVLAELERLVGMLKPSARLERAGLKSLNLHREADELEDASEVVSSSSRPLRFMQSCAYCDRAAVSRVDGLPCCFDHGGAQ